MSHWSNTTFIRLPHPQAEEGIYRTLKTVFAVDGYEPIDGKPDISAEESRLMQYRKGRAAPIWGAAFIPGKGDWHVVKTAPFSLLALLPRKALLPRLAHVTANLRCHALYVDVTNSCYTTLETDGSGKSLRAGASLDDLDIFVDDLGELAMDDENVSKDTNRPSPTFPFGLRRDFNKLLARRRNWEPHDSRIAKSLTGLEEEQWDNTILVEYLILGKPIPVAGAQSWYFRR